MEHKAFYVIYRTGQDNAKCIQYIVAYSEEQVKDYLADTYKGIYTIIPAKSKSLWEMALERQSIISAHQVGLLQESIDITNRKVTPEFDGHHE